MPDYLSCGSCHAEFEVVDFYRFLNHKLSSCHVTCNGDQNLSGAEAVLECSKCLKKCRTPWALLQHLQAEHCMSLGRTLLLPSADSGRSTAAPFPGSARHQHSHVDQSSSEACTQTTRSCLKRQVCPYEEGLPEECCLKASKEQLASDSGCCCKDSFGGGGCGSSGSGSCGGGGGGGGNVKGTAGQSDCCLAVPKKRRLLTAAAANSAGVTNVSSDGIVTTLSAPADAVAEPSTLTSSLPSGGACCGLQADCNQLQHRPAKRSAECQTDFVVNLLDLDDVDLLLEDAEGAGGIDDVPTSLVGGVGVAVATAAAPLTSSTSPPAGAGHEGGIPRRPPHPAPSKAIQTVSRVAVAPEQPLQLQLEPLPPPSTTSAGGGSVGVFYSMAPATLQCQAQTQQQQQLQALLQYYQNQQQQDQPVISLALPLSAQLDNAIGSSSSSSGGAAAHQHPPAPPPPRPKSELKYRCTQCARTFRQNIHLRKHVMSQHSHSKPHKCPSCDYTTVEKSHLTVHIRKHTGERPFSCRDCDYSTAQNCTLKAHYLRKHPGSAIHCGRCGLEFVTEHERDKHERSCSGGAADEELLGVAVASS